MWLVSLFAGVPLRPILQDLGLLATLEFLFLLELLAVQLSPLLRSLRDSNFIWHFSQFFVIIDSRIVIFCLSHDIGFVRFVQYQLTERRPVRDTLAAYRQNNLLLPGVIPSLRHWQCRCLYLSFFFLYYVVWGGFTTSCRRFERNLRSLFSCTSVLLVFHAVSRRPGLVKLPWITSWFAFQDISASFLSLLILLSSAPPFFLSDARSCHRHLEPTKVICTFQVCCRAWGHDQEGLLWSSHEGHWIPCCLGSSLSSSFLTSFTFTDPSSIFFLSCFTGCASRTTPLWHSTLLWPGCAPLHPGEEGLRGSWEEAGGLWGGCDGTFHSFHQVLGWSSCLRSPTNRHAVVSDLWRSSFTGFVVIVVYLLTCRCTLVCGISTPPWLSCDAWVRRHSSTGSGRFFVFDTTRPRR